MTAMDHAELLHSAADRLEALADRTTPGDWRLSGLLATRPEVKAHRGTDTEHVAEARSGTGRWITAFSPALAGPLGAWLRAAAAAQPVEPEAVEFATELLDRLR